MIIQCPCCGERIEVVAELSIGQHVVCPYCGQKFSYGIEDPDRVVHAKAPQSPLKSPVRGFIDAHRKLLYGVVSSLVAVLLLLGGMSMFGAFDKVKVKLEDESVNPMTCDFGGELSMCLGNARVGVKVGTAYFYDTLSNIKVSYIIPKKGVLASDGKTTIYVETDRVYVDGAMLMTALYTCIGRATVIKANGDQVVAMAFEEVDEKTGKKRMELVYKQIADAEKAEKKAAEDARMARAEEEIKLKAARDKANAELAAQKAANDRKLAQLRAEQERKAEAERVEREKKAEAERIAEEKKQAEEAKKRYPIEQKERADYTALKFSGISFSAESRFMPSRSVRKSLRSYQINEKKWSDIQRLIQQKDWLKLLSFLLDAEVTDYPPTKRIDMAFQTLMNMEFHLEMKFAGPRDCYRVWAFAYGDEFFDGNEIVQKSENGLRRQWDIDDIRGAGPWMLPNCPGIASNGGWQYDFTIIAVIHLSDSFKVLLFDNADEATRKHIEHENYVGVMSQVLKEKTSKLSSALSSGKIDRHEYSEQIRAAYKSCLSNVMSQVTPLRSRSVQKTESGSGVTAKKTNGVSSAKSNAGCPNCGGKGFRKVACQDCKGTGRVVCSQCNGAKTIAVEGEYRAGLGGRNLSMRSKKACPSCKGEGKTWCKSCKGRGKISVNCDRCGD